MEGVIRVDGVGSRGEVFFYSEDKIETKGQIFDEDYADFSDSGTAKLKFTSKTPLDENVIYCRVTKKNKLIRVKQGSNKLEVKDLETGLLDQTYSGKLEEPYTYEMYRSFRYAKEDQYPLWRRGGSSLVLLDPKKFEVVKDFKKFWPPGYIAMRCCINTEMTRIYGFSFNENDGIFSILDINKENQTVRDKTIKIPKEQKWIGMEFTTAEDTLIIANSFKVYDPDTKKSKGFLKMMAADLSNMKIKLTAQRDFTHKRFRTSQLFRKIKGYDYFVVASGADLSIIAYTGNDFVLLSTIEKIYKERIVDISIFGNYMIPVAKSAERVKLIEFNVSSYNSLKRFEESKHEDFSLKKESLRSEVYSGQQVRRIDVPFIGNFNFF